MLQRNKPRSLERPTLLMVGLKHWVIAIIIVTGALGAIVAGISGEIIFGGTVVVLATYFVTIKIYLWHTKKYHLPVEDLAPSEEVYILNCPCNESTAREANALTKPFYGQETVPFNQYVAWLNKNPYILVCLHNRYGDVDGYFDVLPLQSPFADDFIAGRKEESDITENDIFNPEDARNSAYLYLGGIAVRDPKTLKYKRCASFLIWGLVEYLRRFYPVNVQRNMIALASTPEGEALLRRFGFHLITSASGRMDKHNLYSDFSVP